MNASIKDSARGFPNWRLIELDLYFLATTLDVPFVWMVGVPGDVVELVDNVLHINGVQLDYEDVSSTTLTADKIEDLLAVEHFVRISKTGSQLSTFGPVTVPVGQYLAMGDNRDNSIDSRVIGFVPRHEIVGRSRSVVLSLNYENSYIPRSDRFFKSL